MTILFAALLAISAPPTETALDSLIEKVDANSPANATLISTLEAVAASARTTGKTPRKRYGNIAEWQAATELLKVAIGKLDPTVGESSAKPLHKLLLGACTMLKRRDLYEVQSGLTFLDIGIQPLERLRWASADQYKEAIAELVPSADNKTREALIRWLSRHGGQAPFEALLQAATTDKIAGVRALAAQGLARCTDSYCPISHQDLVQRMGAEADDTVRSHWIALAGRLGMTEVLAWCKAQLGRGPLDNGCRTGLTRLRSPEAFSMLYTWLEAFEKSKASLVAGSGFGAALALLGGFARKPFVKGKILKIVDRALARRARSPMELVPVAGMLGYLDDKKRSIRVAEKHRRAFSLRGKKDKSAMRVAEILKSTVDMLKR